MFYFNLVCFVGIGLKMVKLYHYTDLSGCLAIAKSGYILKSTGNNAAFGEGVYLTEKDPSNTTEQIVLNNYDRSTTPEQFQEAMVKFADKTKFCFEFESSNLTPTPVKVGETQRNVWLYKDSNLELTGTGCNVWIYKIVIPFPTQPAPTPQGITPLVPQVTMPALQAVPIPRVVAVPQVNK